MGGTNNRHVRDPYFYFKVFNMVPALAVIVLSVLGALLPSFPSFTRLIIFALASVMCAGTGIMELSKGKHLTGYTCSVLSGLFIVALILTIII